MGDRLLLLDLCTCALMVLALALLLAGMAATQGITLQASYALYDAPPTTAKARMLLTRRDEAAAAVALGTAAAVEVPAAGGLGRWLLPAGDAGFAELAGALARMDRLSSLAVLYTSLQGG